MAKTLQMFKKRILFADFTDINAQINILTRQKHYKPQQTPL